MRTRFVLLCALLVLPAAAWSQSPFSIEVGGDVAVPIQDFGNASVNTGLGFGGNVRYRVQPHLAAYAGWEWQHFTADLLGSKLDVDETGYTFGLRFEHPFGSEQPAGEPVRAWWIRAGGLLDHIELEDENGDPAGDSKHGLGWEAGLGLSWPVGGHVALTPGIRMRMLRREIDMGLGPQKATLSYVTLGVGATIGF